MKKEKTVIDVRSPEEFSAGHTDGAINIPLPHLGSRLDEIKAIKGEILLCCASGVRSTKAHFILHEAGIERAVNAGSWVNLKL